MSLLNYLATGTYSVVDQVQYSKQEHWVRFNLRVISNNTKQVELAAKNFEVYTNMLYKGVLDITSTPPATPQVGDSYIVGLNPTGVWEGRSGTLAIYTDFGATQEWAFWGSAPNTIYYDLGDEDYFTLNPSTLAKVAAYPTNDSRLWDLWLADSLVFSETSNLFKQLYLFLKSRPGFESVIDG